MSLAPWRSPLARALHRHRSQPQSRYVQLATVRPDGLPANRTVVFRGWLDPGDRLQFITDRRSAKLADITHQPWAEICWYFAKTREQFRLLGSLTVITADTTAAEPQAARQSLWQSLSDAARSQFAGPAPGQPPAPAPDPSWGSSPPDPQTPLPSFCLVLLTPIQVDHLELRTSPHQRSRYTWQADTWQCLALTP